MISHLSLLFHPLPQLDGGVQFTAPFFGGRHVWCYTSDSNSLTIHRQQSWNLPKPNGKPTYHSSDSTFSSTIQATRTLTHHEAKKLTTCRSIPDMNRDVQLRRAKSSATMILLELVAMLVALWWFQPPHRQCLIPPLPCCCKWSLLTQLSNEMVMMIWPASDHQWALNSLNCIPSQDGLDPGTAAASPSGHCAWDASQI